MFHENCCTTLIKNCTQNFYITVLRNRSRKKPHLFSISEPEPHKNDVHPQHHGTTVFQIPLIIDTFTKRRLSKRILTKRILYKTYTHAAYTNKTYTHAAYTVTKRILYRTYTEAGFLVWIRYVAVLKYVPFRRKGMTLAKKCP
jgi:hypothetical protein